MASWKEDGDRPKRSRRGKPREAAPGAGPASWQSGERGRSSSDTMVWEERRAKRTPFHGSRYGGYLLLTLTAAVIALFAYAIIIHPTQPDVLVVADLPNTVTRTALLNSADLPEELLEDPEQRGRAVVRGSIRPTRWEQQVLSGAPSDRPLAPGEPPDRRTPRVVYITGHGFVRPGEEGEDPVPTLGFDGVELDLDKVIDWASDRPTVLALDTARGRVRWEEGQLCNFFPEAAQELMRRREKAGADESPLLLISAGVGQRDWPLSPTEGRAFGQRFFQTLAGDYGARRKRIQELWIWPTVNDRSIAESLGTAVAEHARRSVELLQTVVAAGSGTPPRFAVEAGAAPEFSPPAWDAIQKRLKRSESNRERVESVVDRHGRGRSPLLLARSWFELAELQSAALAAEKDRKAFATVEGRAEQNTKELEVAAEPPPVPPSLAVVFDPDGASPRIQAWRRLCANESVGKQKLLEALESFAGMSDLGGWRPTEVKFASLLVQQLDWEDPGLQPKAVVLCLRARAVSERLAHFEDPRVHAILRSTLEPLESERRRLEDELVAGRWGLDERSSLLGEYEELEKKFRDLDRGFADCDLVLDMAPWAGEWWLDELQRQKFALDDEKQDAASPIDQLKQLASDYESAISLTNELHRQAANALAPTGVSQPLPEVPSGLTRSISQIDQQRDASASRRLTMYAALRAAENPATKRVGADELLTRLKNAQKASENADPRSADDRDEASRRAEYLGALQDDVIKAGLHPVMWMLGGEIEPPSDDSLRPMAWFTELGASVRSAAKDAKTDALDSVDDRPTALLEQAGELADRSVAMRKKAWMVARLAGVNLQEVDPFWTVCKQEQNRWLARRAIEDFWGDLGESDGRFYFAKLAHRVTHENGDKRYTPERIQQEVEAEIEAAEKAARAMAPDIPNLTTEQDSESVDFTVSYGPPEGVPAGQASLHLRPISGAAYDLRVGPEGGELGRRIGVALKGGRTDQADLRVQRDGDGPPPRRVRWTVDYRGHRRTDDLALAAEPTEWRTVRHDPDPIGTLRPNITVHGKDKRMVDVVIVLDASYSMRKDDQGGEVGVSKMENAKAVTRNLLRRIANDGNERYRVSFFVYGHRADWKFRPADPPRWSANGRPLGWHIGVEKNVALEQRWHEQWKALLHPSSDVERVFDLRLFNRSMQVEPLIERYIDPLRPYGVTPLYLAISEALTEFRPSDAERHMIVLTDGNNEAPDKSVGKDWSAELVKPHRDFASYIESYGKVESDLKQAHRRGAAPKVTVIGYGGEVSRERLAWLEETTAEWEEGQRAKIVSAADRAELEREIEDWFEETLKLPMFDVARSADRLDPEIDFEGTWETSDWSPAQQGERVVGTGGLKENVSERVQLEGWEALHLEYIGRESGRGRLIHWPYSKVLGDGFARGDRLIDQPGRDANQWIAMRRDSGARGEAWRAAAVSPGLSSRGSSSDRRFHVALQHESDSQQSLAPRAVWAEIEPRDDNGSRLPGDILFFGSDVKCVRGRNVPILEWSVEDWPATARTARLQLWAGFERDDLDIYPKEVPSQGEGEIGRVLGTNWRYTWRSEGGDLVLHVQATGDGALNTLVRFDSDVEYVEARHRYARDEKRVDHEARYKIRPEGPLTIDFLAVDELKERGWSLRGDARTGPDQDYLDFEVR